MKKQIFLLSILALLTFIKTEAQTYVFGAIMTGGINVKYDGVIKITDSTVVFKDSKKTSNYKLIKNTNGIIYFTDEVMTHYFTEFSQSGTKKGFEYDTVLTWFFDKRMGGDSLVYWCKKETK